MIKYIKQLEKYTCYFTDDHLYYKEMMVSLIREDLLFKVIIQGDNDSIIYKSTNFNNQSHILIAKTKLKNKKEVIDFVKAKRFFIILKIPINHQINQKLKELK